MTRRRWIADSWDEATAVLTGAQAGHLARVLRAQPGMEFDVVVGDHVWRAAVATTADDEVRFRLISELSAEAALPITLLLSIFKFDRMEWAIEKATELGVARIAPILARRSAKHLMQAAPARVERWRRIALEASKQSRRSDVPEILDPTPIRTMTRRSSRSIRLLLAEQPIASCATLHTALKDGFERASHNAPNEQPEIYLAIGPEGGWTDEEQAFLNAEGWTAVSLGPRILRAETAAIAALAVTAAILERHASA